MKKFIFCTSFLLLSWAVFSQEKNKTQTDTLRNVNELKIATFQLLLPRLSVEYEHMLDEDSSFGGGFAFGPDSSWIYYAQGFYRVYFFSNQNYIINIDDLFGDIFLGAYGGRLRTGPYSLDIDVETKFTWRRLVPGAGFSLGKKWIHKKGFILQIQLGYGITTVGEFINGGVYFGYRF